MYAIMNMMCNQKLRFEFSFVSLRKSNDFQYSGLPVLNCIQLFDSYRPISIDILHTVAAHLRAATLMETQHFFSKGHSVMVDPGLFGDVRKSNFTWN